MARMQFGGGPEDVYLIPDDQGDLQQGGGVIIRFYSTETGNNPITDLLDRNLSPITYITTSTGSDGRVSGQIAPFSGPDAVYEMWAGADNQPRFLMQASNLGSQLGPIRDQYLQHVAQSNGHNTRLQDLVNVSTTGAGNATDGQALVYNATSGLWTAGTVAAGSGSAPANMATTDTTQTISGAKTLSGALTTTGGATMKPSAIANPAAIVQALASQTGNVQEWRDSTGAVKAWMTSAFAFRAPNLAQTITFAKSGALATGIGTYRWWNDTGFTLTILAVRASIGTASTSGAPVFDLNKVGTTVFTTQANRPTIAVGSLTSGKVTGYAVTTIADGEYLTCDVDVAGTGAADAVVQVLVA
jgi:hypothetical protein